jgi:hypothetical protein
MEAFSEVECMGKVVVLTYKKIMEKKLKIKKKFKKVIVNVKHKKCMGYRVLWFSVCHGFWCVALQVCHRALWRYQPRRSGGERRGGYSYNIAR